jgi:hypothetical protein
MKKRLLLLLLLVSTVSFSQSTLTGYKTLINAIGDGEKNTARELRSVFNSFTSSLYLTGDIKEVDCTNTYILLNFDATGLGINDRAGWAICNGLNGTKDRNGRVGIGYGSSYTTMGVTGGSKDAVVVSHNHVINEVYNENTTGTKVGSGGGTIESVGTQNVSTTGVSGTDKNMQPYIVTLYIQKL